MTMNGAKLNVRTITDSSDGSNAGVIIEIDVKYVIIICIAGILVIVTFVVFCCKLCKRPRSSISNSKSRTNVDFEMKCPYEKTREAKIKRFGIRKKFLADKTDSSDNDIEGTDSKKSDDVKRDKDVDLANLNNWPGSIEKLDVQVDNETVPVSVNESLYISASNDDVNVEKDVIVTSTDKRDKVKHTDGFKDIDLSVIKKCENSDCGHFRNWRENINDDVDKVDGEKEETDQASDVLVEGDPTILGNGGSESITQKNSDFNFEEDIAKLCDVFKNNLKTDLPNMESSGNVEKPEGNNLSKDEVTVIETEKTISHSVASIVNENSVCNDKSKNDELVNSKSGSGRIMSGINTDNILDSRLRRK